MYPITNYPQVAPGVYESSGEKVNVAAFLELFDAQPAEKWRDILDEVLLFMVNAQEQERRTDFHNLYWDVHSLREAFKESVKPVTKAK